MLQPGTDECKRFRMWRARFKVIKAVGTSRLVVTWHRVTGSAGNVSEALLAGLQRGAWSPWHGALPRNCLMRTASSCMLAHVSAPGGIYSNRALVQASSRAQSCCCPLNGARSTEDATKCDVLAKQHRLRSVQLAG